VVDLSHISLPAFLFGFRDVSAVLSTGHVKVNRRKEKSDATFLTSLWDK
jgi:hypothetical protein